MNFPVFSPFTFVPKGYTCYWKIGPIFSAMKRGGIHFQHGRRPCPFALNYPFCLVRLDISMKEVHKNGINITHKKK